MIYTRPTRRPTANAGLKLKMFNDANPLFHLLREERGYGNTDLIKF